MIRSVRRCVYVLAAVAAAGSALLAWSESAEAAVSLTVGGVPIVDGGPMDLDGIVNDQIVFDSAAGPAGFALPGGSSVGAISGKLIKGSAGSITLTDVAATKGAGGAPLPFTFGTSFAGSVPKLSCSAQGYFSNAGGTVGAGSAMTFACDADGAPVPSGGPLTYTVPASTASSAFFSKSATETVSKVAPPVTATGTILLTTAGDELHVPYSFHMYDTDSVVGGIAEPSDLEGALPSAVGGDDSALWSSTWLWTALGVAGLATVLAAAAGRLRIRRNRP